MQPVTKQLNNPHFKPLQTSFFLRQDGLPVTEVLNTENGLQKPSQKQNIEERQNL